MVHSILNKYTQYKCSLIKEYTESERFCKIPRLWLALYVYRRFRSKRLFAKAISNFREALAFYHSYCMLKLNYVWKYNGLRYPSSHKNN